MVTEQSWPVAAMVEEQQSLASSPGMLPHPAPPHCPHAASQHTSLLSIPARPLLQVEFVSKVTAEREKKKKKWRWGENKNKNYTDGTGGVMGTRRIIQQ